MQPYNQSVNEVLEETKSQFEGLSPEEVENRQAKDGFNELKEKNKAIVIISSEMPEILGMSDRIIVMNEGYIKGELSRQEASQEKIMHMILDQA